MISIIVGTNRPGSRSSEVAQIAKKELEAQGEKTNFVDLKNLPVDLLDGTKYSENKPKELIEIIESLHQSRGYVVVSPEYNGSMPGILKYFIDHWEYPKTFEHVPVCFIGLGGRFGGLRPVEHLQQVFNYRNAFVYPDRVFIFNVWEVLKEGLLSDAYAELIKKQMLGFSRFIKALEDSKLHPHVSS